MMRIALAIGALSVACTGTPSSTEGAHSSASVGGSGAGAGSGAGGVGGGHAGGAPPLVDDGIVARYFIDEAARGQTPTAIVDAAPDPLNLALTYIPEMAFVERNGHRGLEFTTAGLDGRASVLVDGTKLQTRLTGAVGATIEAVVAVQAVTTSGSRLVHVGFDSEWWFTLGSSAPNRLKVVVHGYDLGHFVAPLPTLDRTVIHAVIDNGQADVDARARLYVNGGRAARTVGEALPQNEPIDIPGGKHFAIGNREIGGRTIQGIIYYAAVYDVALTEEQIAQNALSLSLSDDSP